MKLSHILGAAVAAPAAVCLARALAAKPTAAVNAKIDLKNDDRAKAYGEKLSRMVRCETISSRDHMDLTKFEKFHSVLADLFPHVHAGCEKHVFDGSLLFKWAGRGEADPIILMSLLCIFVPSLATQTSTKMIPCGVLALAIAFFLWKKDKL